MIDDQSIYKDFNAMNEQMINYRFVGVKGDTNDDLMTAIARNKMHKVGQICNVKYCASNE